MKKALFLSVVAIVVVSLGVSAFFYWQYSNAQKYLKDPTLAAREKTDRLVNKVGKLMDLPHNEEPTLAEVKDITKLKDQEFFAKAHNGDEILIYTAKKEIILYRESTNKIINVAPITINSNQKTAPSPTAQLVQPSPTLSPTKTQPVLPTYTPAPTPTP